MAKIDLKAMELAELQSFFIERGQPKFRADQVYDWLHKKLAVSFTQMTNLPKSLIAFLEENCTIPTAKALRVLTSRLDGTKKYLLQLPDGQTVETVLMKYSYGYSVCVSSEVGCKMGCTFCASTKAGFIRRLSASEILEQVYFVQRETEGRIGHIVLMGIGEPLDNFDEVLKFLHIISSEKGLNIGMRNISLSTCGLVPMIRRLQEQQLGLTLSISLHAPFDELRSQTMPINRRYPIAELIAACREYASDTKRRISFEYALIRGFNDDERCAAKLVSLLKGMLCHVNLIPVNEIKETSYQKSEKEAILRFEQYLNRHGITATVRRTLGADINAACGQLRREEMKEAQ